MDKNNVLSVLVADTEAICLVVIPCYNEARRLQPALFSEFLAEDNRVNFLFVNDGSSDGTLEVLTNLREQHPERIEVLDQQPNRGKAEAVRCGMLHAMGRDHIRFTGYWDADLATPLSVIPLLLCRLIEDGHREMVFGSRVRLLGHQIHRRSVRHYLGRCFATAVSIVLNLPVYDTQCGAKLLRITPALKSILAAPFQSRWIFDVEIIARYLAFHQDNLPSAVEAIYEHPLPRWEDVAGSKVQPTDFFVAFYELLQIRKAFRKATRSMRLSHRAYSA